MQAALSDLAFVQDLFQRIATDLELTVGQELSIAEVRTERCTARVAGRDRIHVSFRVAFQVGDEVLHGCVLLPLPEALTIASYLLMLSSEEVAAIRELSAPDGTMKEALLEIGNFVAGSIDAVVRKWFPKRHAANAEGCQGVRPNVRPAFPFREGSELVVGRARACLEPFGEFELIVMLPPLEPPLE